MKQKVIYLFAMLCFAQTVMAQITSLGLVEESNIAKADKDGAMRFIPELSFAGDYLYVATPNGIFKTPYRDAEASSKWEKLPLTDSLVLDIEVRGNTLIALTRDQLIYSVYGGKTAISMSATEIMGDDKMYPLECMAVHPHNAKELLVTNGTKLMWTNDGGAYWEEIETEIPTPLTRLFYNPSDATQLVGISNDYTYHSGALLYSHDSGQEWTFGAGAYHDSNVSEIYNVAFHPKIGDKMVACGVGVYGLSDDGGASWTSVFAPKEGETIVHITDILYDARKPNVLYGADWGGMQEGITTIVRSTDGGYTWKTFYEASLAPNAHVLSIDMKDNLLALYTYGGGIYLLDVDAVGKPQIPTCLVNEDKQWAVCTYSFRGDHWTNTYRLRGDTTINGKTYKIEHESQEADLSDMRPSGRYMREENGKVYSITDKDKREELFFDYTMQVGDTLRYNPTIDYYGNVSDSYQCIRLVAIRDTVMPNGDGKVRKSYHVQSGRYDEGVYHFNEGSDRHNIFIEDIGFIFDGLSRPSIDLTGSSSTLLYVLEDYTTLYMADQEPKLFSKDTKWYGKIYTRYNSGHSERRESLTYHIGSDTITDRGFGQNLYRNNEYWGTLITKGEQVWIYPSHNLIKEFDVDSQEPFLLYDFSLQPGDTLYYDDYRPLGFSREKPEDDYFQYMVAKKVYNTYGRKVIEFNRGYKWAEGIGRFGAPILNLWRILTTNGDGITEGIDRVEANGQIIYSNGEIVNPNIEPWLKAGMTWTENKQYTKDGAIVSRKVTISEGGTPGYYKVSSDDSEYELPFEALEVINDKIYGHGFGDIFLLYDFSLKVGDKISLLKYYCYGIYHDIYKYDQCYVTKVDTAVYNGVPRKRITLSGDREDVWVEGIGSLTRVFPIDAVNYDESVNAIFSEVVECTYNGETLYHKSFAPTIKKGYGIYRGDTYLEAYTIDESKEVTDSTDYARWHDKTVLYFDVDTIGPNAFTGATLRQGQILYFTERLNTIFKDAFTGINILRRTSQEARITDDLTLVFAGENAPNIDKNRIIDYANSTYYVNFVVPDIKTYVAKDLQWTYAYQMMTIDDFIAGYISPENEVAVSDSTGVDLEVGMIEDNSITSGAALYVAARPKKDIPVRIGDGENKDIYSRAPAWMRYTVEVVMTDSKGDTLYTDKQQCNAYDGCYFEVTLTTLPEDGIVCVYSRSIDQYGNASDWTMKKIHLMNIDSIAAPENHSPYYDLMGREVAHPTRGIYIKDGRKVVIE